MNAAGAEAPFVSVIIPVFGAAPGLDACLEHLARQSYPADRFEVIVVDNHSRGSRVVDAIAHRHRVAVVREPRPGSFSARNAGVLAARGEVLAFTDDDCLPEPEWLARGVESLAAVDATGIVAGGIYLVRPRPPHVSPVSYAYSAVFSFRANDDGPNYGATANLFVRRDVFERVGPFDATLYSGGDWAWGKRAHRLGLETRWDLEVRVVHQARPSIRAIVSRELRLAGGMQVRYERTGHARTPTGMVRAIVGGELRRRVPWALRVVARESDEPPPIRARLALLVVLVQLLRAAERMRIYAGGTPRRA